MPFQERCFLYSEIVPIDFRQQREMFMPVRIASACPKFLLHAFAVLALLGTSQSLRAFEAPGTYQPIAETAADKTITLTGHDLTIEEVIAIARDGAKVKLSDEALQRDRKSVV